MAKAIVDLAEQHVASYEALKRVAAILDENGIDYFLLAGTTLGAVRHGGFIPWDDDIDLGIYLKDKDKVAKLLHDGLPSPFSWIDRNYCKTYPRYYGKVLHKGVGCVDVFLLVKTSDQPLQRKFQWAVRKVLFKTYKSKIGYVGLEDRDTAKGRAKLLMGNLFSCLLPLKVIESLTTWNENLFEGNENPAYYVNFYSRYRLEKEMIKAEWLQTKSYVQFNDCSFPTIGDVDAYLKHLYGDYMKLPPEEQRVAGHGEYFGDFAN